MDDVIYIKKSLIGFSLNLLWVCLAGYWVVLADATLITKLSASSCILLSLILVGYRNRMARNIVGEFSLNPAGLMSTKFLSACPYEVSLHQLLPWCLHLKLSIDKNRFETLIWRDALCQDDWRKLRRYLLERANKPNFDRG